MKKILTTIVVGVCAAFALTACAPAAAPAASSAPASEAPAAATEAPASEAPASETPAATEAAAASEAPAESQAAATDISGKVQLSGSTSMETIANALAEGFMLANPNVSVDVQLGGSSVGAKDAMEGKSDIGNISRELKEEEAAALTPNIMAIDGIAVIVNPANTVKEITKEDLIKVYTGEIKSWKDLGGADEPIVVIGREAASGTRGAFEELLKIEEQAKYAQELNETGAVKTAVSTTPAAIGYVSLEALDDTVIALNLDGAPATEEAIKGGSYALSRPFIMATAQGDVRPEVQAFIDYVMGDEGQAIVADNKLISIK